MAGVTAVTTMIAPKTLMLQVMKDCTEYDTEVSTDSVSFVNLHSRPALYEMIVDSVLFINLDSYQTRLKAATAKMIAGVTAGLNLDCWPACCCAVQLHADFQMGLQCCSISPV